MEKPSKIYFVAVRTSDSYNPFLHVRCEDVPLHDCFFKNWSCVWSFADTFGLERHLVARSATYQGF